MSGISGIVCSKDPTLLQSLRNVAAELSSRGPDSTDFFFDQVAALAQNTLRVTVGAMKDCGPRSCPDNRYIIVWDGRIDNRNELAKRLSTGNTPLRDETDAELALQVFCHFGEDLTTMMQGDFAFAIWDTLSQRLFMARDRLGVRPLYFVKKENFFAFASHDEVLLAIPEVSNEPNEDRIAYALFDEFEAFDFDHSWLQDVWTLSPGHHATFDSRTCTLHKKRYWQLASKSLNFSSDAQYEEAFLEIFEKSVRLRLRTDSRSALLISGGLDTAAIVGALSRSVSPMGNRVIDAYSVVQAPHIDCIESSSIRAFTELAPVTPHFLQLSDFSGFSTLADLMSIATSRAHPVDNSLLLPSLCYEAAARNGNRVVMHATSGDLVNYVRRPHIAYYLERREWRKAIAESIKIAYSDLSNRGLTKHISALRELLRPTRALISQRLPKPLRTAFRQALRKRINPPTLSPEFADRLQISRRLLTQQDFTNAFVSATSDHARALFPRGLVRGLDGHSRLATRYGVDTVDPWADVNVLEFFAALPIEQRIRGRWNKSLVRRALSTCLPAATLARQDKTHLGHLLHCAIANNVVPAVRENVAWNPEPLAGYSYRYKSPHLQDEQLNGSVADDLVERMALSDWLKRLRAHRS